MSGSEQLTAIKAVFTAGLQGILGAKLLGAYIYSAAARFYEYAVNRIPRREVGADA